MSKQMQSLHMLVEADYICNLARQAYWFEENETWALRLLKESFTEATDDQINKIINGDAMVTGWSICDDKNCTQCKGLDECRYVEPSDDQFKLEILKRRLWLNQGHIRVGRFHVEKKLVIDLVSAFAQRNRRTNEERLEYYDETVRIMKNSFWNTVGFKKPSERYIPKQGSLDYEFTQTIVPFLDEVEKKSKNLSQPIWYEEVTDPLFEKYAVIKEPLSENFVPKAQRIEGCMLVTVIDPKTDEKKSFNLRKEYFLLYVKERQSSINQQKILMHKDIDSEKVKKVLTNLEKKVGYAHKEMMESMNLWHSESGHYDANRIEHNVNAILQWYMYKISIHNESNIEKLPEELFLDKNKDAYVDGKLVEEKIDTR